jgi:hypothetical protein
MLSNIFQALKLKWSVWMNQVLSLIAYRTSYSVRLSGETSGFIKILPTFPAYTLMLN